MSNLTKKEGGDLTIRSAILEIVQNKDIDPDRLEKLIDLQIKMEDRQAKMAFQQALSGFQGDCPIIPKSKKIKFESSSGKTTKYNYSPLDQIAHIIKPHLKKWGLSYSFNVKMVEGAEQRELITKIYHEGGYSEEFSYFFMPFHDDKRMNQSQRAKSSITYAKRACLENSLGLITAEEDDDANRAIDVEISDAQLEEIRTLMSNTKTDEKKLLAFLKVDSFEDLSDFEAKKAVHSLKQKRSQ